MHWKVATVTAALGAGLMYLFDPKRGRGRRATARDRMKRVVRGGRQDLLTAARDVQNRVTGLVAESIARVKAAPVSDHVLVERIRSRLGHIVTQPRTVSITAADGVVHLNGTLFADEAEALVRRIRTMRGVAGVENTLVIVDHEEGQGAPEGSASESNAPHGRLPGAQMLLLGAAGGILSLYGVGRRNMLGVTLGTAGAALTLRSVRNRRQRNLSASPAGDIAANGTLAEAHPAQGDVELGVASHADATTTADEAVSAAAPVIDLAPDTDRDDTPRRRPR